MLLSGRGLSQGKGYFAMTIIFDSYFAAYKQLVKAADEVFRRVQREYPDCVKCKPECADCCHALFDLTLIEAAYISHCFHEKLEESKKHGVLEKTNVIDRKIYKLKRKAFQEMKDGRPEEEILDEMAAERVRCPLLNDQNRCDLYEDRPITCRLYGIPTSIGGVGRTCGFSGFQEGKPYPTVNIDAIHQKLYSISAKMVKEINSRYVNMAEMLVPLSMAILNQYDEIYLGIIDPAANETPEKNAERETP
jgi:Fe-S-cluster containining protein